ncbi:G-PROTEIN-RECEP-F1-2 domain-containing protein [Aphelenchoides fujianensis]|nr:G-PROTEIN-RECEP-F1-2 domain-containing protein [Aphelenchoides fujianensis]
MSLEATRSPLSQLEARNTLEKLILYHSVDVWIGAIGSVLNLFLLFVFCSKRTFFRQNMMFVVLAVGDFSACLGTLAPFVWLRMWGSVLPSAAVLYIGFERFLAVLCPVFYRDNLSRNKRTPTLCVLVYALLLSLVALGIAFTRRNRLAVYYCGRKAAFTHVFSTYVYSTASACYIGGLLFNVITLISLGNAYAHRRNIAEVNRQLRILRYLVLISSISTVVIMIPNLISLFTVFYGRMNLTVSESGSWLFAVKSSLNLFIYTALKTDFRARLCEIFGLRGRGTPSGSGWESPAPNSFKRPFLAPKQADGLLASATNEEALNSSIH